MNNESTCAGQTECLGHLMTRPVCVELCAYITCIFQRFPKLNDGSLCLLLKNYGLALDKVKNPSVKVTLGFLLP